MKRRPIELRIGTGRPDGEDDVPGVDDQRFREVMSRWAVGVTIVAVRDPDDERIYGTTVSSFGSVSARPPRIVISLGPGAQVLPFLKEESTFVVNVLARGQEGLATRFADSFPVGSSPFPAEGHPVIADAHASLICVVKSVLPVDACRLVVGLVEAVEVGDSTDPLLYYDRDYRGLAD